MQRTLLYTNGAMLGLSTDVARHLTKNLGREEHILLHPSSIQAVLLAANQQTSGSGTTPFPLLDLSSTRVLTTVYMIDGSAEWDVESRLERDILMRASLLNSNSAKIRGQKTKVKATIQ